MFLLPFFFFFAVDEQGSTSKASLSCSTLEKLRGFSCHADSEGRAAYETVRMESLGTGRAESAMREHVEMEEDAEGELVQNRQVRCFR